MVILPYVCYVPMWFIIIEGHPSLKALKERDRVRLV